MLNPTLKQLFGQNATQDAQNLTIYKSDLPLLTVDTNNRAEQLLVAILLKAHENFEGILTDKNNKAVTSETGKLIKYDNKELYEELTINYWKSQYIQSMVLSTFICEVFELLTDYAD